MRGLHASGSRKKRRVDMEANTHLKMREGWYFSKWDY
jgi:hypothetical protein